MLYKMGSDSRYFKEIESEKKQQCTQVCSSTAAGDEETYAGSIADLAMVAMPIVEIMETFRLISL